MEFSLRLALLTWVQSVIESYRKNVTQQILAKQISRLTSAVVVDKGAGGLYDLRGIQPGVLSDLNEVLEFAEKMSHGTPGTRMLKDRITKQIWDDHVQRFPGEVRS